MPIPQTFYSEFRIKNSFLAFGTGVVLGAFFPILSLIFRIKFPFFDSICWGVGAVVLYQFAASSYFFGKRRGAFEYTYRENMTDQQIARLVKGAPLSQIDRDAFMVNDPTPIINKYLDSLSMESDLENKFWLHMTLASLYGQTWEYNKAMTQLEAAAALKPNDLVANFRLAEALERTGKGDEAIRHYEAALDDPSIESGQLKEFVVSQIQRVRTHGPSKDPQYPFKKYIWG